MQRLILIAALVIMGPIPLRGDAPVQITEFAAAGHQGWKDEDGDTPDWVELQNVSAASVNLEGWTLSDAAHRLGRWRFPATNLPPGKFLVVFASGKNRQMPGQPLHTNFRLRRRSGGLWLQGPNGDISTIENYPPQVAGVSFGLAIAGAEKTSSSYSYLTSPTPGRSNSPAVGQGPWIMSVSQRLSTDPPVNEQPVIVTARVLASREPVAEVALRYRVMFGREVALSMHDDGQDGDRTAGDGIYTAAIPGLVARPGQMLRYCVVAADRGNRTSRWPLFANRRGYSGYCGTAMADPTTHSRLPVLQLFSPDDRESKGEIGVAVFYEGEFYDQVAVALHGQISRGFPKPSYNLDFPRDHLFQYRTNAARVNDLTLLTNFADKSKIRNTLAYEMIAASGSIGHFAFPVRVQRNGHFFSVAEMVEDGDERWLERVGRDRGGALYKMYDNLSSAHGARKKTRRHEDASDLAAFARAVSESRPLAERAAYAYDHIDIPQCISYLVAMALISSSDHGHKNYYLYRDSRGSGDWALLPWDVDLSWGRNWTGDYFNEALFSDNPLHLYRAGRDRGRNRLYNLFFEAPEFRQMYLRRLRTVMDELLQPPGTPAPSLIIDRRVRQLMDLIDPREFKPSDADLDNAAWPGWGRRTSMRAEAQRIIDEYLKGRRRFLFQSARAKLFGDSIPEAQPADVTLALADVNAGAPAGEQFVCITNANSFAVDLSGWRLAGAGIEHLFRPGTVIPSGQRLYVAAEINTFRHRSQPPHAALSVFAQGNWKGSLRSDSKKNLELMDLRGRLVASRQAP